tara:strand:- start:1623 stop:2216 length:594 start_codon:yes stop_codon:yes gene_type:complete
MGRIAAKVGSPLFAFVVSLLAATLDANQQALFIEPASIDMDVGMVGTELTVSYVTVPGGLQTAGAGISVFFDSTKLRLESLIPIYAEGFVQASRTMDSVIVDTSDLDDDHSTDKRAIIAYTSFSGRWPDSDSLGPLQLFNVAFVAASQDWSGETQVNFVVTSLAAGFSSKSRSVTIRIQGGSPYEVPVQPKLGGRQQ